MKALHLFSLGGLRAVEAVGRLGGLRAAADELNVSPGAVSQHVQKVEAQAGVRLFERLPTGMVPTARGARMVRHLRRGMMELAAAVELVQAPDERTLTVSVAPVFAGRWLVWRLEDFRARHPDIRIGIDADARLVDPARVDVCIRSGDGGWSGASSRLLVEQLVFPVCSPHVARRVRTVKDLDRVQTIKDGADPASWRRWLAAEGGDERVLEAGPTFSNAALCIDAAIAGLGVFTAWETLVADALLDGRLVAPFAGRHANGLGYWSVTASSARRTAAVDAFEDWLVESLAGTSASRS